MKAKVVWKSVLVGFLGLLLAAPPGVWAQGSGAPPVFTREELEQMLAPIALYPDSLLAQVLVAATYPLEVVQADRWVKENKNLKGERLAAAADKMSWDLSVKALVPFPQILGMMSEKLDWMQRLGDAFLAQQADVMNTVQDLRARAQTQGTLKTTSEQKVIVQEKTIVIEPTTPTVVYVPAYDPAVVYGAWPYPAYPPYAYYPPGYALAGAAFGFAAGVAVGAAWSSCWGNWNWSGGSIDVNVNRNFNINGNHISHYQSGRWQHDVAHRGGVAYRDSATRERYGRQGMGSAEARRDYRGYSKEGAPGQRPTADQTRKALEQRGGKGPSDRAGVGGENRRGFESAGKGSPQRGGKGQADKAAHWSSSRPGGDSSVRGSQGGNRSAFSSMGSGSQSRMSGARGESSRSISSGSRGASGRQSFSSGGRSGGGFGGGGGGRAGGGGRGGGGGGRR